MSNTPIHQRIYNNIEPEDVATAIVILLVVAGLLAMIFA